jgi:cadmium resistance protein CadD (predicted permease)
VSQQFAIIGLALATWVSTSLDNFLLLVGLLADDGYPRHAVVAGYLVSVLVVLAVSWAGAEAVEILPPASLGYLGVLPFALGAVGLFRLIRRPAATVEVGHPPRATGFLPVLLLMLANSGDTLAVFVPVFGDTAERFELTVVLTASVCAVVYTSLATWLVTRSAVGEPIQRAGRILLPFLLMAIGAYIFLNTGTDPM